MLTCYNMWYDSRIAELTEQLHTTKDKGRAEKEALLDRLREITAESTAAKLENQSLKATASAVEEKLSVSQLELQQVKVSIRQYEGLLDSYKMPVIISHPHGDTTVLHCHCTEMTPLLSLLSC